MYLQYSTRNEIVNAGGGGGERPSNCLLVTLENLDVRILSSPAFEMPRARLASSLIPPLTLTKQHTAAVHERQSVYLPALWPLTSFVAAT